MDQTVSDMHSNRLHQLHRGRVWSLILAFVAVTAATVKSAEPADKTPGEAIFTSGEGGYNTYRIPSLAVTRNGTILAFCEGRKMSGGDSGEIDLLVKRSTDGGTNWSEPQVVWTDPGNTCGNPCAVVDRDTGTVWLLATWNNGEDHETAINARTSKDTRRVFVLNSTDDGKTWGTPLEITSQVKDEAWTWYATGPGSGIQMERGPHAGRLVIPCDHFTPETKSSKSHVIYSDDHGRTWQLGGSSPDPGNECEVVELPDGVLMLNMRNADHNQPGRQVCISKDGGATWTDQRVDATLIEPVCQAAIRRYSWPEGSGRSVILFSNPASSEKRKNLTVRASFDEAVTWPVETVINPGGSAYSDLAVLPDGRIACLYETWLRGQTICFVRFPLDSLKAPEASANPTVSPQATEK